MPGVVRTNKDRHIGHPSVTPNPFHQTNYATGSPDVFANSEKAVRIGDKTYCTDVAIAGSPNVFVNSIKWHRFDDATGGHSSWIPNKAQTGSTDIFANDPGSKLSGTAVSSNTSTSVTTTTGVHGVSNQMAVRKLTPVECERLQGFPDNYTNIKENCPDGHRYKAMGNSMAVPVMRWIGERINNYKEENYAV